MDWNKIENGVFLVNVLGVVYNSRTNKILIGRREKDPYIKELGWCFPGGTPIKGNLKGSLKYEIKVKTGLDVNVKKIILARIPKENKEFLLIYYYCEVIGGKEKAGEKFKEVKWVKPSEVKKYFKTSVDPELMKFLKALK